MKKITLLMSLMLTLVWQGMAQISSYYTFSESTGTYTPITGGTVTTTITGNSDDGEELNVPIGFTLDYAGTGYSTVNIGVNGAISFTNADVDWANDLAATAVDQINIIAPLWDDLYHRTADAAEIRYETTGTSPNQVFTVQWTNISWRNSGNNASFQLVLFEASNNIQFNYGPNTSTEARTASIGFNKGNTGTDFISVTPGAPGTASTAAANNGISSADYPGNGVVYLFTYAAPSCPDPSNQVVTNVTTTSVDLGWTDNAGASMWDIEWDTAGFTPTGVPTIIGTTTNPHNLSGLTPNTSYEFYVRADCGGSGTSNWVGPFPFFTGYCPVVSTSANSYMDDFSTTGGSTNISNLGSGYAANGYEDATAMVVSSYAGGSVNFTTAFVGTTVGYNIWVDWNNDLDFDDPGEDVYLSGGYVSSASGTITVPGGTPVGSYRMRMRCDWNATSPNACGASGSGRNETEDYTFDVVLQQANDLGVVSISSTPAGCGLGMETVSIIVENFGTANQSNFDVVYSLNGTPITPETVSATLNGGDTMTYVFTTMANMSTPAQYTIDAWTELATDGDNNNDTLSGFMTEHLASSLAYFGNEPISNTIAQGTNTIVCTNGLVNNMLDSCYMLSAVVLDSIPHTWETDLDIYLISPAGDTLELSTDNGTGSGSDGYMNVTFTDTASTNIAGQTAIDGGFFQPEELAGLAKFNGTDPNGAWTLRIIDDAGGDDGAVGAWHLEFTDNNFAVNLGGDTTVCSQNPLTLMAGVTGNHTYNWSTGQTTDQITVDTTSLGGNGVYNIYVTVTDTITGCASVDTIEVTYAICSGIDAVQNNVNVNIAPNPNNGQFVLNVNTSNVSNMTISVVNLQGQTIYAKTNFDNISQVIEPIDLGAQANGIYFVVITTDKGISTHRVVKQ